MKRLETIFFILILAFLLASCHRSHIDPFIPKDVRLQTQFKFSKTRNRTVEKHVSFAASKGRFSDSFGSARKRGSGGGFSGDSYSSRPKKKTGGGFGNDSFSSRSKKRTGGGFAKDSYSSPPNRKRSPSNAPGSFDVRVNRHYGAFAFNSGRKRVSEKFSLTKRRDVDAGSFGHGKRSPDNKQYAFDKKAKMVKKRDGIGWDIMQIFKRKKYKKHKQELELFDPDMKKRMNLGK